MVPTCTPCPECGKECEGHGDAVARGACYHSVRGGPEGKRACPRHYKAGKDAGPHWVGDVTRCGCCAGTCDLCWGHTGGGANEVEGHTWPTAWVKLRVQDSSTSSSGAGEGRVRDDVGARTAEGWRQFFTKNGGEEDEKSGVKGVTDELESVAILAQGCC